MDISIDNTEKYLRFFAKNTVDIYTYDKITVTNHFNNAAIAYVTDGNNTLTMQEFINKHVGIVLTTAADTMNFGINDELVCTAAGNDRISADSGNDTLYSESGNDSLSGDDLLVGGIGNDTYLFGRGDGQDMINNDITTWQTDNDRLRFQESVAADQLWFQKSGSNPVVRVIGTTTDKVTITNWYSGR